MLKRIRSQLQESMWGKIVATIFTYWYLLVLIVVCSIVAVLVEVVIGYNIQQMVSYSIVDTQDHMNNLLYVFGICVMIGMIAHFLVKWLSTKFSSSIIRDLRNRFAEKLEHASFASVEKYSTGDLLSRFSNDLTIVQRFLTEHFPKLIIEPLMFIAAFVYLFLISWKLILFSLSLVPFALLFAALISKPLNAYSYELQQQVGRTASIMKDTISGIPIIKVFHLYEAFFRRFKTSIEQMLQLNLKIERRHAWLNPLHIIFMSSPLVFCILFGAYLIAHQELKPAELIAFIYFLGHIIQPVSVLPELIIQFQQALGSYRRTGEILSLPEEEIIPSEIPKDYLSKDFCLQFNQISFTYDEQKPPVLHNLDFELKTGRHIAVVGPSGGGKSTIVKLLCGLYVPNTGHFRVNGGHSYSQNWDVASLLSFIAYVPQDVFLFSKSIAENIAFGKEDATLGEIVEAATLANAHEFISGLSQGYQTVVGEGGFQLSGGQKQRIAIARAFIKNAPFIIMDEPTSALDAQSELLFQEGLKKLLEKKTVVMVAHRFSSIRHCDEIWVLDRGNIVERGTHRELMKANGLYRKLYDPQVQDHCLIQPSLSVK
ncbi:ABC transporter ATP-binding protein [Brevibacillus laterosporus]|uniref:ABC transporter ATP-binding protein n=1 Tax=Brevibacillus laterosporus TaxID=1465 RepID=UPI00264A846C|nr:ABC transporter ATP-binding protein [Brevibacillus laterosporus]MDN9010199.1 ABC transporter ATP-binding protein [Brevibacillus laterosporus]MDO0941453.1 ABC transporter ATP-binding protein [Brevibacillus laterosporus]